VSRLASTLLFALTAALVVASPAHAQFEVAEGLEETWYVIEIDGEKAGWMREWTTRSPERVIASTRMEMKIARGGMSIPIAISSESVETPEGEPVRMSSTQEIGGPPMTTTYRFRGDHVRIMREQGDASDRDRAAIPEGGWLPPGAAGRLVSERIAAGEEAFSVTVLDPSFGLNPVESVYTRLEEGVVDAFGKTIPAVKYQMEQRGPISETSIGWFDEDGHMVRTEVSMMGLTMRVLLSEREVAVADAPPAELLTRTFIKPDRPIDDPREVDRAVYTLRASLEDGESLDVPETGMQRVFINEDGSLRVEIDRTSLRPAPEEDADNPAFLAATPMIDAEDPEIAEMTRAALRGGPRDKRAWALRLEHWVHAYIDEKDLSVGFATASQVHDARVGDCTEHAVLLAAMLRSAGIPARVANGLVYADQFAGGESIFAYHMWTQALLDIDGRPTWVDLDAALPGRHDRIDVDATHIALGVFAMSQTEPINAMAALARGLHHVEIEVLEFEHEKDAAQPAGERAEHAWDEPLPVR
jgi:hypothetical protein